jgi:hypothetical protein
LLTQRNVEEAARAAGIGAQTLNRWLKTPEFQAEILLVSFSIVNIFIVFVLSR